MESSLIKDKLKEKIVARYEKAGYRQTKWPSEEILRFHNEFSIHFVFLFHSLESLGQGWETAHNTLIDDYRRFEGPRDMEWNYYSVFVTVGVTGENTELRQLRQKIQTDTAYSRKFVFVDFQIDELPPGAISREELKSREIVTLNPLEVWEEKIGQEAFRLILEGPKSSIEKRLRLLIERRADAK